MENRSVFADIQYKDQNLLNEVRDAAEKKFGKKNSYTKNLWILKEYKNRGGAVKYSGKKPSKEKIQKQVKGSFEEKLRELAVGFFLQKESQEFAELIETDEELQDLFADLDHLISFDFDGLQELYPEREAEVANEQKIDEVYKKYHDTVNMTYSQLKTWADNPCSKVASLSRGPINRNLSLLSKRKQDWTMADVRSANRTISFVSRMKGAEQGKPTKSKDGKSCPSKRDISLKNWAFNP